MRLLSDLNSEDKKKIRETPWDIVVHHGECPDGVTAAWIVLRKWDWKPKYYGSEPGVVPYQVWEDMKDINEKTRLNILVVDLSFPLEVCDEISCRCNEFLIIDHHQTAARNLSDRDYFIYGGPKNTLSGAGMVKDIYGLVGEEFRFVDYVSDRDTWQNLLPDTKAINLAMSVEGVFGSPKILNLFYKTTVLHDPESCMEKLVKKGNFYLEYQERLIYDLIYTMKVVNFHYTLESEDGKNKTYIFPIAILNSNLIQSDAANYILRHQSEIRKMREDHFPEFKFAVVYAFGDPTIDDNCGFRIRCENLYTIRQEGGEEKTIGADDIAVLFGGGGHAKAAGFYCSAHTFFEKTTELSEAHSHPKDLHIMSCAKPKVSPRWHSMSKYQIFALFVNILILVCCWWLCGVWSSEFGDVEDWRLEGWGLALSS